MPRDAAERALTEAANGAVGANVALMRLLLAADSEDAARDLLAEAIGGADGAGARHLAAVQTLWRGTPDAFALVRAVAASDHGRDRDPAGWSASFDDAAALSPEASVALYSFGRADLLAAATHEITLFLQGAGLTGPGRDVLDLGCGIGRMLVALAPLVGGAVGLDISPRMVAEARRRTAALGNVAVHQANGRDLEPVRDRSVDLVLAVDSFPYIVEAGPALVEKTFAEARRVLRPGGGFTVMNYSYRGDPDGDRAEVAHLAAAHGLLAAADGGTQPFRLWDGRVFLLRSP